jgi:hypothetical protein
MSAEEDKWWLIALPIYVAIRLRGLAAIRGRSLSQTVEDVAVAAIVRHISEQGSSRWNAWLARKGVVAPIGPNLMLEYLAEELKANSPYRFLGVLLDAELMRPHTQTWVDF